MNLPPLLILKGVFMADLVKPEPLPIAKAPEQHYSTIPTRFTTFEAWPKATNLLCWNCGLVPAGVPTFVPLDVQTQADGSVRCRPHGNFCSWPCVMSYVAETIGLNSASAVNVIDTFTATKLFAAMFARGSAAPPLPDLTVGPITLPSAPPRWKLKAYCGKEGLTHEEWLAAAAPIKPRFSSSLRSSAPR